jgi:hypothetical protein
MSAVTQPPSPLAGAGGELRANASNEPGVGLDATCADPLTRFARLRALNTLSHEGRGNGGALTAIIIQHE